MVTRRQLLKASGVGGVGIVVAGGFPRLLFGQDPMGEAIATSDLIYVTPLKSNGEESRCQSEIWFVPVDDDLYVCTGSNSWRARAVKKGVDRARIWVGDLGNWRRTNSKYKSLPQLEARANVVDDPDHQEKVLRRFGEKYTREWDTYGPRFRNGLADGSRTMIRYRPVSG